MQDPIPKVSDKDVERIIVRDFGVPSLPLVMEKLSRYKSESKTGVNRIRAAILKLSSGKLSELEIAISTAIADYRDVIAWTETPLYFREVNKNLSEDEKSDLLESDWINYQKWFLATEFLGEKD